VLRRWGLRRDSRWFGCGLVALLLLSTLGIGFPASAAGEQPYKVSEFLIAGGPGNQGWPIANGHRVIWGPSSGDGNRITIHDLASGQDSYINRPKLAQWPLGVDGDTLVTTEENGIYAYHLPDGSRTEIAAPKGDATYGRTAARISGDIVVWAEGAYPNLELYAYSLSSKQTTRLNSQPVQRDGLALRGNVLAWVDRRNVSSAQAESDIYGYDLAAKKEFRITSAPEPVTLPAITDGVVVWGSARGNEGRLEGFDLASATSFEITTTPGSSWLPTSVAADGDLVVWSGPGPTDEDVWGYDLAQRKSFIICRAIGGQSGLSISGQTVVWTDWRHSGVGKYEGDSDIYAARLEPGPSDPPPAVGVPGSTDAKIEIVWPHDSAPVTEAKQVNVTAALFVSGTLLSVPREANYTVRLYRALNNGLVGPMGVGTKRVATQWTQVFPVWDFNDVDVQAANDPTDKYYSTLSVDELTTFTSVWAHGADPRTYFPKMDAPEAACE